jgi:hypothetical protein
MQSYWRGCTSSCQAGVQAPALLLLLGSTSHTSPRSQASHPSSPQIQPPSAHPLR